MTLEIQEQVPLAPYTTLRIGGPARYFAAVTSDEELRTAVGFARERGLPVFVLGGGSNLLVTDEGFPGLVIHTVLRGEAEFRSEAGAVRIRAAAGMEWDELVRLTCTKGISGMECLAGIPGRVGGSPIQNIGAYGQEVGSSIVGVRALDQNGMEFVTLDREACRFGYRSSVFNTTERGRYLVTGVEFSLDRAARPKLEYADLKRHFAAWTTEPSPMDVYKAVREIRDSKGMLLVEGEPDCRSAGSFFKNPVVEESVLTKIGAVLEIATDAIPHWPAEAGRVKLAAAWLLDQAGFHKGFVMGRVGISSRHTLALINRGHARYADIAALRDAIQSKVQERFGVGLEQEPVVVGAG
jgi:UDP-N-acetylmuramate dehydrogenase